MGCGGNFGRQLLRLVEGVANSAVMAQGAEDGSQAAVLVWVAPMDDGVAWGHAATARRIVEHCPITIVGVHVRILAPDERDYITSTSIPDRRGACGPPPLFAGHPFPDRLRYALRPP